MSELLYVYDSTPNLVDFLEEIQDCEWTERFWGDDTIRFTLPDYIQQLHSAKKGNMVVIDDLVYRIDQVEAEHQGDGSGKVTINGKSFGIMEDRTCLPPAGLDYDEQAGIAAETAIKHYVDANLGPSAAAPRRLPNFVIAASAGLGGLITYRARYNVLAEVVADICKASGLGWKLTFNPAGPTFTFNTLVGTDRTATVWFDVDFETALKMKLLSSDDGRKNFAYIGGSGVGAARTIATKYLTAAEPTGWDRRELFMSEKNCSNVVLALQLKGSAKLTDTDVPDKFSLDANPLGSFQYGTDYFLGDLVTVRNQAWGVQSSVRVVGVKKKSSGGEVPDVSVELGAPWPKITDKVTHVVKSTNDSDALA